MAETTSDQLFAPPTEEWQRLSPKYKTLKLVSTALGWPILLVPYVVVSMMLLKDAPPLVDILLWLSIPISLGIYIWRLTRIPRVYKRWGYAERGEDVYITHGLWSRSLTCVPYGRMQFVEVEAGPIERMLGLATVSMTTASSDGSITIPGLENHEAEQMRDRFINRGQHLKAGI